MRKPIIDISIVKERLNKIKPLFEDSALILFSHPEYVRNNDVHHPYRQDSNFFYLTGFEEPGAIFVWRPGQTPETVLFVRPKDPEMETWNGFRYGTQLAGQVFQMDAVYEVDSFEDVAPRLLKDVRTVFHGMYQDKNNDDRIQKVLEKTKDATRRSGKGFLSIKDPVSVLGDIRLFKSAQEIENLKVAGELSANAHISLMKAIEPGMNERELHGIFIREIMAQGAAREGYGTIVASGNNATTLHYVFNDDECKDGDLILVDGGGEYNYYTGDITRVFPVNGKFTDVQKRIYNKVLDVQKKLIDMIKPGNTRKLVSDAAVEMLTQVMVDEGLLSGSVSDNIENRNYTKYYPHGFGHWLGMDVHDSGRVDVGGESRSFEAGMCLTVEPGLYVPLDDMTAPEELRGIGIRIEDNILVTSFGNENLTKGVTKEVDEIESIMQQSYLG